jgi:hypothetical protein
VLIMSTKHYISEKIASLVVNLETVLRRLQPGPYIIFTYQGDWSTGAFAHCSWIEDLENFGTAQIKLPCLQQGLRLMSQTQPPGLLGYSGKTRKGPPRKQIPPRNLRAIDTRYKGANLAKPTNFGTRRTPSLGLCHCQAAGAC